MPATPKTPLRPQPLPDSTYKDKAWGHVATYEGIAPRIYSDSKGVPTLGPGYALSVYDARTKLWKLRDLTEIGAKISDDAKHPYIFSDADKKRLEDVVGILNGRMPPPDPRRYRNHESYKQDYDRRKQAVETYDQARALEARKLILPFSSANEPPSNNWFGFSLRRERARPMAEELWEGYRKTVHAKLRELAKERGWSDAEIDQYLREHFRNSSLELALTAMQYNGVTSPAAIGALLDGLLARVREEIFYRSNPERNGDARPGLVKRREAEAKIATGPVATWEPVEKKAWDGIENSREARSYRLDIPEAFGLAVVHVAGKGETLDAIAQQYRVSAQEIREANRMANDAEPNPGTRLRIPNAKYWEEKRKLEHSAAPKAAAGDAPEAATVVQRLRAAGAAGANPVRTVLLKPPPRWTEEELHGVMEGADYASTAAADPFHEAAADGVSAWFRHVYGDEPQRLDVAGRPIPPRPVRPAARQPSAAATPDGEEIDAASDRVLGHVARAAADDGLEVAIRALQGGLNRFARRGPRKSEPLREDGVYGPRTDFALKRTLATIGVPATEEAFGLGRLHDAVSAAQATGGFEKLAESLRDFFGGEDDASASLQGVLGDLGFGNAGGEPAAANDADALQRTIESLGPETLVRVLGAAKGGSVHVRAYTQTRSGHAVDVAAHQRGLPGN